MPWRGQATKQDGRLECELRALAIPGGVAWVQRQPENPPYPAPITSTAVVPLTCAWGLCRCELEGQELLTRARQRGPARRGGVAPHEGRRRRACSGYGAERRAARTVKGPFLFYPRTPRPRRRDSSKRRGPSDD
ncbi:hypothetical protein NDU88_005968 [Pleurodeles waltl]|uniref:Uncharacterized protein n=1 Tax=Pleurodeles waltl TaxID=8319 RepID=A0AAV7VNA7_PLEWA|nr:hypothetical protein NDU88_005968 [Pleurodeles waltl]